MKTYHIDRTDLEVTRLGYGCMKLGGRWDGSPLNDDDRKHAWRLIETALETGYNLYDHADLYMVGKSEQVFGEYLAQNPSAREQMIVQTKCGIRPGGDPEGAPGRYDFSYEHITNSVEGSLKRLQTDVIDILLLHRPDALMEPEEVARAFDDLHRSGKVRVFGVSNHTVGQMTLLARYVNQPLVINQLQLNMWYAGMITEGMRCNQDEFKVDSSVGLLDYCRLHKILIQAWSPVQHGALLNPGDEWPEPIKNAAKKIKEMAKEKGTTPEAIAMAWLLRHPAGIQPLVGTSTPDRIRDSAEADDVEMSREEWYLLLETAQGKGVA